MTSRTSYLHTLCVICVLYVCVVERCVADSVCHSNGIQHVEDADLKFGLMLQLRDQAEPEECEISARRLQHYLTVEWLLDRINSYDNGAGYIPGVKIGYTSYDDCGQSIYSVKNSISLLNDSLSYMSTCSQKSNSLSDIAIIGPSSSSSSMAVSSLIKDYKIPIISPMSTIAELSDKTLYPTFYRTIPSDEQQMSLIVDMLEYLRWTYIAVVYQNDDYGKSARSILEKKAKERGICIHGEYLALPEGDGNIGKHFNRALQAARDNSIAVVVIADAVQTDQFMFAVDSRVSEYYRRGLHFILTNAVNLDVDVFKTEKQGQGTLTFTTQSQLLQMEDLKAHLNEKFKETSAHDNPLINEYVEKFGQPQRFVPKSLDSFLPSTINAVMALTEALKAMHAQACGAVSGACQNLKQILKDGELVKYLSQVRVDYSNIPETIVPKTFHESQLSFGFDAQGDLHVADPNPSFDIHSYDSSRQEYKQVGAYIDGRVELDITKIHWLRPGGEEMLVGYPSSMCADEDSCDACKNNGLIPIMYLPGDLYIVGIFSLHDANADDPFKCGVYRNIAKDAINAEGFLFAVKELQAKTGIKFGAIGFDACYSQLRVTSILTAFFSDISPLYSQLFPVKIPRDKVVGAIGCLSSGCTIAASRFFTPLNIPVISYSATSPDLDDRMDFPIFMRTVPSDVYQAQVMMAIIQEMGWEYVGLVYVDNNYGAKGMKAFRSLVDVEGSGICAAIEISISDVKKDDDQDLFDASRLLISQNVKVVVFFGTDMRARDFVHNLETYDRWGKFIFLASEDWGNLNGIKNAGPKAARGSITLKLQTMGLESEGKFRSHLINKKPTTGDTNVWFSEFLEAQNNCHFKGSFNSEYQSECRSDLKLTSGQVTECVNDQRTRHTINAVYAMGKGLNATINSFCKGNPTSCAYLKGEPKGVAGEIKKQMRKEGSEEYPVFDPDGNGAIGYTVYNIQLVGSTYEYVAVGQYGPRSNALRSEQVRFYDEYNTEMSSLPSPAVCDAGLCDHCQHKKPPAMPVKKEEPKTSSIEDYRDSDILLISLVCILILAVIVAVVALCICYRYNCKGMFQKNNNSTAEDRDRDYEQIRHVYPGHFLPQTANLQFSDPNISPYVLCGTLSRQGVTNPTFQTDLDSVSARVMSIDTNIPYGSTTSGNMTTNQNSIQSVAPSTPSSRPPDRFKQRQTPSIPSRFGNEGEERLDSSIKYVNEPHPSRIARQSSVVYSALATPSLPLNPSTLEASQNAIYSNRDSSNDVILAKDSSGKLVAYVASPETAQLASNPNPNINAGLQTAPVQSPASFGPYSYAAALQQQRLRGEQQLDPPVRVSTHEMAANLPARPMMTDGSRTPYEEVEMQNFRFMRQESNNINNNNNNYQAQISQMQQQQQQLQQQLQHQQHISAHLSGNQNVPMQYATPTHLISTPNSYSTPIPMPVSSHMSMIQQQSLLQQQQLQQQQSRPFSEPTSTTAVQQQQYRIVDPALQHLWASKQQAIQQQNTTISSTDDENPHNQSRWRDGIEEEENIHDPPRTKDQVEDSNLYVYPDSNNSLHSIPDLVAGKMPQQPASPSKSHREADLESIDLDTDSHFEYEQDFNKSQQSDKIHGKPIDIAAQQQNNNVTSVA